MGLLFASLRIYDLKTWWHWSTVLFSAIRNEKGFFIHFLWLSAWRRTCLLFDFLLFSVILPQFDRPFLTSQVWAAWLVHIIVLVHYKIYKGTLTKATLAWFCRNMNLKNVRGTIVIIVCDCCMRTNPIKSIAKLLLGQGKSHCLVPHDYQCGCVMSWRGEAQLWHWSCCLSLKLLKSMSILLWVIIWTVFLSIVDYG